MKTSRLLLAFASAASLGMVALAPMHASAQTPEQRREEAAARARASRPVQQPRPQPRGPGQQAGGGVRQGGGGVRRPPQYGGGGSGHVNQQGFAQNHAYHEAGRRQFFAIHQSLIQSWIANNYVLYVHAENSDGSATGDANSNDWDEASTDAVQACIDDADQNNVDDSSCQITNTSINPQE